MTATVLKFPAPKVKGEVPKGPSHDRLFFCTGCTSKKFYLDLDEQVWCATCNAYIANIKVKS